MYLPTEAYVKDFSIPNESNPNGLEPRANQYLIVNSIVNRSHQMIVGLRQDGTSLGTLMAMKFLVDIEEKKVVMVTRNNMMRDMTQTAAEEKLNFRNHDIIAEHIGMTEKLEEYDVVIVDAFHYSRFREIYLGLLSSENPPKLIFTSSLDNIVALNKVSSLGGKFDVLALVNDPEKLSYLNHVLNAPVPDKEEHDRMFFNKWTTDERELTPKEKNRLGIREDGEGDRKDVK